MKNYIISIFLFLLPITSFASEIDWQEPTRIDNLGYFAKNPPENPSFPDYGYYESMTRTFAVARVVNNGKNIGEIFLMLPNLQPYRAQERIYVYHTATGNMIIQDISNTLDPKGFIVTPWYIASSVISPVLRQLNLPKKIYKTSIGGYVLDFLPMDVKNTYSSENYKEIGTFFDTRTRKNEPLYIETNTGSANGFYLKRLDGTMALYMPHLSFLSDKSLMLWNDGKRRGAIYVEQDGTVCGSLPTSSLLRVVTDQGAPILVWKDSNGPKVEWLSFDKKNLKKVGKTRFGQDLYALPDNDPIYKIYYDNYFPENTGGKVKRGLEKFIQGKPFLFYKDGLGRYIFLLNESYYNQMLCA